MKFRITFKDPDVVSDAIVDAVIDDLEKLNISEDEKDAIKDLRIAKLQDKVTKWFKYMEYVTVEVDTEKDTAIVIPNKE